MDVTTAPRFSVRVPDTWFEFDVWRATHTADLGRLVDQRITEQSELKPHRSALRRNLRQLAEAADRAGAVYCAAGADDLGEGGRLLASLTVLITAGMPEPLLNTVEAIAAQLPTVPRDPGGGDWREVRLVDLPAGRAVRVRAVSSDEAPDGSAVPSVAMHTLIPVPGSENVLNVVLTSPQVALTDALLELFDAISATLTWEEGPPLR